MRTTDVYDVKRTGDLGGDRVAMKIDQNSIAHLMSVLTDLYSDPVLAVIREYSTNARDSHVEAGVTRPIEVTLPNGMNPYFKVRDFGVGLSVDDITNIYSQYGASTKRDTDEQTGMLGLGCKSALTYTSQFTVVGIKNGVKATVLVSRVEDGTGVMEIVDTVATTEHNGVEISVPSKNTNDFHAKTMDFFRFWKTGTVLVNGQPVDPIVLDMITPTIGLASYSTNLTSDVVVMGGVAYPCGTKLFDGTRPHSDRFNVVSFVEIGDVHFVPSREALSFTKRTETKVAEIKKTFTDNLLKKAQDDINSKTTHHEAYNAYVMWSNRIGNSLTSVLTYNGLTFPDSFTFKGAIYRSNYSRMQVQNYVNTRMSTKDMITALHIHNFPGVNVTSTHKAKIRQYKAQHGITTSVHILTLAKEGDPWVPPSMRISWDDVKSVVLPSNGPGARRGTIPVEAFDPALGYFKTITDLDKTKVPCYLSPTSRLGGSSAAIIVKAFPNIQIVVLGENRWEKFKRENPTAKTFVAFLKNEIAVADAMLSSSDKQIISLDRWEKQRLQMIDSSKIDDPELKNVIDMVKGNTSSPAIDKYNAVVLACRHVSYYADSIKVKSVFDTYPLLSGLESATMKHAIIYLNAVYKAKQDGTI